MPPKLKRKAGSSAGTHPSKRARERTSLPRDTFQRRLEALARLLEGSSQCVAITQLGEQCFITANELKRSSRAKNRYITQIETIMTYFRSDQTHEGADRIKFLEEIFFPLCLKSAKDLTIPRGIVHDIIQQVVDGGSEEFSLLKKI